MAIALLAACSFTSTPAAPPLPTPTPPPEVTGEPTPVEWIEHEVDNVVLGVEKPRGWQAQQTDDGILLVEHSGSMTTTDRTMRGVQVHIFVHSLDGFELVAGKNRAWSVLEQIIQDQKYLGSARADKPYGFEWSQHDAAYYLSNNGDGNMTMLIAIAMPDSERMVACNITSPASEADRIRDILPLIFDSLTVNGLRLDVSVLNHLPDPLVFPPNPGITHP